ncbi:hypothetical protein PanWU01x14_105510 [Parasponia andersonii]|uniref:Uncharacterized protein n=1 Tax=Parasponia andersonii TaxID=3476 RepID=A0A2P5D104_PARAD|nr:hypothetical protein PanWU01x14_105510 [Parasponia andersonii]
MKEIRALENKLEDLLSNEEHYWRQRSHAEWLKSSDRNIGYFYQKATDCIRKNNTKRLRDNSGVWNEAKEDLVRIVEDYFGTIFQLSQPSIEESQRVVNVVTKTISPAMAEYLDSPFTSEDIKIILFQMGGGGLRHQDLMDFKLFSTRSIGTWLVEVFAEFV